MIKKNLNRIPLDNIKNIRSFGGYEIKDNLDGKDYHGVSKHGVFYRSGLVSTPTEKDLDIIINDMNVRTIYDFRSDDEIKDSPNYFDNHETVELVYSDLFSDLDDKEEYDDEENKSEFKADDVMGYIYVATIETRKEELKFIFEDIAKKLEKGAILYHCRAGKDRTAIISMFIESIIGMCRKDIISDYTISTEVLEEEGRTYFYKTEARFIMHLLDHLDENYGGPVNYLKSIGVKEETFDAIKKHMLVDRAEFLTQKDMDLTLRRINLKTIDNFRSPAGYPTTEGGITRHGVFYRCGLPHEIANDDINRIKDLNIKTVLDLRSHGEREKEPNGFEKDEFFNVIHIDVLEHLDPSKFTGRDESVSLDAGADYRNYSQEQIDKFMGEMDSLLGMMYLYILKECEDIVLKILNSIVENLDKGAVLFHCTAGKDRTGVTAMILNKIAGYENIDIISDYMVSENYIKLGDHEMTKSRPEFLKPALDFIDVERKGVVAYLTGIGFEKEKIDKIKNAYVDF